MKGDVEMDERTFKTQESRSSKDVLAFYDKYAATWDTRFGHKQSTADFHRVRFQSFLAVANLKKTDSVVELGVGTGPYLEMISPLVKEVVCIDGSGQMLEVVRAKYGQLTNIRTLQMDLEQPPGRVAFRADLIYWFGLLEHIVDPDALMMNCKGMLGEGGRIVVVASNAKCPWYHGMNRLWRVGKHCSTDRYYAKDTLDGLMNRHGFHPKKFIYWGYSPAGVGNSVHLLLSAIGRVLDKTSLRQYAGGMTASYEFRGQ